LFVPVALVLALIMAVGVLKAKSDAAATRRVVESLASDAAQKREAVRGLRAEVQFLENPARIQKLARDKLGMTPAVPERYAELDETAPAHALRGPAP
jgi:cell division protein FtsL